MAMCADRITLDQLCALYPERIRLFFSALNLDLPALTETRIAVVAGDWVRACTTLLAYYRRSDSGQWLRHATVPHGNGTNPFAEKIIYDLYPAYGRDTRLPRLPSGSLDWSCAGANDNPHFPHDINRHDYLTQVLTAYYATGNRAYARCLDAHLYDWTLTAHCPDIPGDTFPWGNNLDAGHRSKAWPAIFYGLQQEDALAPATRLLMLLQAWDHARYLRMHHGRNTNWVITEMSGLLSIGCAWPEFTGATAWREYAIQVAEEELHKQVYPDGTLKELTSGYQYAVLCHMNFFIATLHGAGLPYSPELTALLERMWHYLAYSLAPNGCPPHNSDSDRSRLNGGSDGWPALHSMATVYARPDWTYIAGNGAHGEPPSTLSVIFPWAGQLVSRSGWDAGAHWSFFDIGPWGTLHQHNDALHLSVSAHGRDLLVDSGRYSYQDYWGGRGTWRSYFIGSEGHNVILVNGMGQQPGPRIAEQPIDDTHVIITPDYDYAQGTFSHGFATVDEPEAATTRLLAITFGHPYSPFPEGVPHVEGMAIHTRAVVYLRGRCWVVVDRIVTDHPRRITPLWHFHPDCTVVRDGQSVVTTDRETGNVRIQPAGPPDWDIELVRGREGPDFQGWYSGDPDIRLPATCACYTADIAETTTFGWLLLPAAGPVPDAQFSMTTQADETVVNLHLPGGECWNLTLNLAEELPAGGERCRVEQC